jgi:DNA-binding CsgD family transcriptional regulator
MRPPRMLVDFRDLARAAVTREEIEALLVDGSRDIGFERVAMLHTATLFHSHPWMIRFDNYPYGWDKRLIGRGHRIIDPVLTSVRRRESGLLWPDGLAGWPINDVQRTIMEEGGRRGLRRGITVPINVPGEPEGSVSFATRSTRLIGRERMMIADAMARTAFDEMRRVIGFGGCPDPADLVTARERECIYWIAQGKTNEDIAAILSIDVETVRTYVKRAFHKLGRLNSRGQLVYEAIRLGLIDVPPSPPFGWPDFA